MVHSILIVIVTALTTILTRALPFVVFGGKKKVPAVVQYLGKVLPCAIMAILVVCCGASFVETEHFVEHWMWNGFLYASHSGGFCVKIMYKSKFFVLSYIFLGL